MDPGQLGERLGRLEFQVRVFAPAAMDVEGLKAKIEDLEDDRDDIRRYIGDVKRELTAAIGELRRELKSQTDQRADARVKIIVAVIAACATVLAALATAAAVILSTIG